MTTEQTREMFMFWLEILCKISDATQENPLVIGSVEFWLADDWTANANTVAVSWKELCYHPATTKWNMPEFNKALTRKIELCYELIRKVERAGGTAANKLKPQDMPEVGN